MGPRGRRAGAVQSTNDSSSLSKCSLAAHGYVRDPFAALLVSGAPRRAPLIHRGYYVRARAVRHCVRAFLERAAAEAGAPGRQIVSLGAGSDSLYFRLKAAGRLARAAVWEVDFPDVAERKAATIRGTPELAVVAGPPLSAGDSPGSALRFASPDYRLLGCDLRDVPALRDALEASGLDAAAPTLLLAEAVLSYLEAGEAAALLAWAARHFADALFVLYEQVGPHDPFGRLMQLHFERLHSPLHGLASFPSVAAQRRRFLDAGWQACSAVDMNDFYRGFLSAEERRRVEALEPFDEFEEWHLKCSHYFILAASTLAAGPAQTLLLPPGGAPPRAEPAPSVGVLPASVVGEREGVRLKRFGHASALLGARVILSTGGFGEQEGRHSRVSTCHVLCRPQGSAWNASLARGAGAPWDGRLFHTMTPFSETLALVLGGRLSPVTPASGMYWLSCPRPAGDEAGGVTVTIAEAGPEAGLPSPRWRHSATKVLCQTQEYLFVYGGRSGEAPVLGDWHFLRTDTMAWVSVPVEGPEPEARHSHSACGWEEGAIIAGGLGRSEEPLGSVYFLKPVPNGFCWERLEIQPPVTPRYSHTAHVLDGKLLLVGGVWIHASSAPGVTVIDLTTGLSSEYHLDTASVPWPLMLHNHTSVLLPEERQLLILGGGGNCFSFGTHLNPQPVTLDISSLRSGP